MALHRDRTRNQMPSGLACPSCQRPLTVGGKEALEAMGLNDAAAVIDALSPFLNGITGLSCLPCRLVVLVRQ